VGAIVGVRVVNGAVGELVIRLGLDDGSPVGSKVGVPVGVAVGSSEGTPVGLKVGDAVSLLVGSSVGESEGLRVGLEKEISSLRPMPSAGTLSMFFFALLSSAEVNAVNASVTETSRRKDRRVEFIIFVDKRYGSIEQICRLWISRCVCRFYWCSILTPAIGFGFENDVLVALLYSRLRGFL